MPNVKRRTHGDGHKRWGRQRLSGSNGPNQGRFFYRYGELPKLNSRCWNVIRLAAG